MDILLQQIINGLVLGSMYALIALVYTMVYGIINLINFAHGEVVMIGTLVTITVAGSLIAAGMPEEDVVLDNSLLVMESSVLAAQALIDATKAQAAEYERARSIAGATRFVETIKKEAEAIKALQQDVFGIGAHAVEDLILNGAKASDVLKQLERDLATLKAQLTNEEQMRERAVEGEIIYRRRATDAESANDALKAENAALLDAKPDVATLPAFTAGFWVPSYNS